VSGAGAAAAPLKVGVVLCGGNTDLDALLPLLAAAAATG
jgi:hypothetical protein